MTRIPPSITKVFKRIAPSKSAPDRQKSKTAAQLELPQKTVRFAEDQPGVHHQRKQSYQADPHMDDLAGGTVQDRQSASKRRNSETEMYPQMPTIVKKEFEDELSESLPEESFEETPSKLTELPKHPGIKEKFPEQYNTIESDLNEYFDKLNKDNLYSSIESITKNNQQGNIGSQQSSNMAPHSRAEKNSLGAISDDLDAYLQDLEKNNLYNSNEFTSETIHDAASDIHLRRIAEKNV